MSVQKRERSSNFSREEVELLTSLVAQYKNILENKKSDAVTWHEKEQCWKTLETIFNSTSGLSFRSAKTLKAKFEGMKRATRKKSAVIRAETYRTGGGPSAAPPLTPIEEKVKGMILLSVDGIESQFDADHLDSTQPNPPSQESLGTEDSQSIYSINTEIVFEYEGIQNDSSQPADMKPEAQIIDDQPSQKDDLDNVQPPKRKISEYQATPKKSIVESNDQRKWNNWKPKSLRSKKHPALCTTNMKRPFERVAESKLELAELQKTILEEELLNKRKQWAFEEEEREHKRELWALEKKYWSNKNLS